MLKIYFEDSKISYYFSSLPFEPDYVVDASNGVTSNLKYLDSIEEMSRLRKKDFILYTNSILALSNKYAWNEKTNSSEIYIRRWKDEDFININDLTDREIRYAHNIAKMYINGEFDN